MFRIAEKSNVSIPLVVSDAATIGRSFLLGVDVSTSPWLWKLRVQASVTMVVLLIFDSERKPAISGCDTCWPVFYPAVTEVANKSPVTGCVATVSAARDHHCYQQRFLVAVLQRSREDTSLVPPQRLLTRFDKTKALYFSRPLKLAFNFYLLTRYTIHSNKSTVKISQRIVWNMKLWMQL